MNELFPNFQWKTFTPALLDTADMRGGDESGRDFEVVIFSEVLCNAKMTHQRLARRVTRALQSNTDAGDLGQGQLENVGQSGNNAAVSK